jgi:hypothetical protein
MPSVVHTGFIQAVEPTQTNLGTRGTPLVSAEKSTMHTMLARDCHHTGQLGAGHQYLMGTTHPLQDDQATDARHNTYMPEHRPKPQSTSLFKHVSIMQHCSPVLIQAPQSHAGDLGDEPRL